MRQLAARAHCHNRLHTRGRHAASGELAAHRPWPSWPAPQEYLDAVQGRSKEKRYAFDVAQGTQASSKDVYDSTIADLVSGVMRGLNGTVFAYGATGSGKTHTMGVGGSS